MVGQFQQRIHIHRMAIHMNREDGLDFELASFPLPLEVGGDPVRIDIKGFRF